MNYEPAASAAVGIDISKATLDACLPLPGGKIKEATFAKDPGGYAALLAYANYYSDYGVMEEMLRKCGGDLGRFVRWIVSEKEKGTGRFLSATEEHLVEVVKGSSCVP